MTKTPRPVNPGAHTLRLSLAKAREMKNVHWISLSFLLSLSALLAEHLAIHQSAHRREFHNQLLKRWGLDAIERCFAFIAVRLSVKCEIQWHPLSYALNHAGDAGIDSALVTNAPYLCFSFELSVTNCRNIGYRFPIISGVKSS